MYIIRHTKTFLSVALVLVLGSVLILGTLGVSFGIDFTGGSLTEAAYDERPEQATVETALTELSVGTYSLRTAQDEAGRDAYILRTRDLSEAERIDVEAALTATGGEVVRYTSIGPTIGSELARKALVALGVVTVIIVGYVAFVFRKVSGPVRSYTYGIITVLALLHDVLIPTAAFAILSYFTGAEIDVLFVMAILATLGYSVNDTIVVFDRVRENLLKNATEKKEEEAAGEVYKEEPYRETVARSLQQTFRRSVNTSVTTFLALLALFIFGGDVTENFAFVLLAGVVAGTYSSLCIASPLLVWLHERTSEKTATTESHN